jgi:hypothetical protein
MSPLIRDRDRDRDRGQRAGSGEQRAASSERRAASGEQGAASRESMWNVGDAKNAGRREKLVR